MFFLSFERIKLILSLSILPTSLTKVNIKLYTKIFLIKHKDNVKVKFYILRVCFYEQIFYDI